MRIMFLGCSGAGKTSLLAHGRSELAAAVGLRGGAADGWRLSRVVRAMDRGRSTPRTRGVRAYRFRLADGRTVECVDHQGSLLDEGSASGGTRAMLSALGSADGIVLVVDGSTLAGRPTEAVGQARRLVVTLRRRIDDLDSRPEGPRLPVVLAVTHMNQVDHDVGDLTSIFDPMRAACVVGDRIDGLTVPVVSGPDARNCAVPMLWCLRHHPREPTAPGASAVRAALSTTWVSSGRFAARPWRRVATTGGAR